MSAFYLLDDAQARDFEPFSLTRPVGELRAGAALIRERWECALGLACAGHLTAPHLEHFTEPGAPRVIGAGILPSGSIVVNARCAVALDVVERADIWTCDGRVAAVRLATDLPCEALQSTATDLGALAVPAPTSTSVGGWWMDAIWDLVRHLGPMLVDDLGRVPGGGPPPEATVVRGDHAVAVEDGACIEPFVVLDATAGPIVVRSGATIRAFTHLVGPCYVGAGSQVGSGRVASSSIGDHCRAHGELSNVIFIGHANKSHDGFVGHSILGRWVNLGAETVTSNLKNTYGTVHVWTRGGTRDTGMAFLGSLVGDHAKTAIGTRLTTGSVIGAGANVVADGMAAKVVPPFCWGSAAAEVTYELDRFLEVAARVMARRQVTLGDPERAHLTRVYASRWRAP